MALIVGDKAHLELVLEPKEHRLASGRIKMGTIKPKVIVIIDDG